MLIHVAVLSRGKTALVQRCGEGGMLLAAEPATQEKASWAWGARWSVPGEDGSNRML